MLHKYLSKVLLKVQKKKKVFAYPATLAEPINETSFF